MEFSGVTAIPHVVAVIFCRHRDALHGVRVALGEHGKPDVPVDVFVVVITVIVPPVGAESSPDTK
jgi:hypothetical protein